MIVVSQSHALMIVSCRNFFTVTFQFNTNFSVPGGDVFRTERAVLDPARASASNFLHPIVRFHQWTNCESSGNATVWTGLSEHHVVEDFLVEFTRERAHLRPLRLYLSHILQRDVTRDYLDPDACEDELERGLLS
jgi:hypothetical protein